MHRRKYLSGERSFIVDETKDLNGYWKVIDEDTKVVFKLPHHVINSMQYVFSWERYVEERDDKQLRITLENELKRLQNQTPSFNINKGISDIKGFLVNF